MTHVAKHNCDARRKYSSLAKSFIAKLFCLALSLIQISVHCGTAPNGSETDLKCLERIVFFLLVSEEYLRQASHYLRTSKIYGEILKIFGMDMKNILQAHRRWTSQSIVEICAILRRHLNYICCH